MGLQDSTNNEEQCSHSERGDDQRQLSAQGFNTEENEYSRGDNFDNAYSRNHIVSLPVRLLRISIIRLP